MLEEGNSFEAEVVKGVEEAGMQTRRKFAPMRYNRDDVPGKYLGRGSE